jgi:hypothetical protein
MKRDYRRSGRGRKRSSLAQQLRQLGDVGRDPPGLVAGEELRRRTPTWLALEIDWAARSYNWRLGDPILASIGSALLRCGGR